MRTFFAAAALAVVALPAFADRRVTHTFNATAPLGGVRRVYIDIPVGSISIKNGDAARLSAAGRARRKYDDADDREEQQRVVDDAGIEIVVDGEEATIRRRLGPNAQGWRQKFLEYEATIELPAGTSVDVGTTFGEVEVRGSFGSVDVDLRAGEVNLVMPRAIVRELNASVRLGDVSANLGDRTETHEGVFPGAVRWENDRGTSIVNVHVTTGDVSVRLTP